MSKKSFRQTTFLLLGGFFFMLGTLGIIVPILPTTPFMILAATFFAESSPRFHKVLLNNQWFGKELRCWERNKTMQRQTKKKATVIIVISFSLSISILWESALWQMFLLCLAFILLFFLWRVDESCKVKL